MSLCLKNPCMFPFGGAYSYQSVARSLSVPKGIDRARRDLLLRAPTAGQWLATGLATGQLGAVPTPP